MPLNEILLSSSGALFCLLTIIQIAPIKINPWSAFARGIGRAINGDISEKVDKIDHEIAEINSEIKGIKADKEEDSAINARIRILRFGDECLHGLSHTKEHFDQTLDDVTDYNKYCKEHPDFKNDKTTLTAKRIEEIYQIRLKNNDFL